MDNFGVWDFVKIYLYVPPMFIIFFGMIVFVLEKANDQFGIFQKTGGDYLRRLMNISAEVVQVVCEFWAPVFLLSIIIYDSIVARFLPKKNHGKDIMEVLRLLAMEKGVERFFSRQEILERLREMNSYYKKWDDKTGRVKILVFLSQMYGKGLVEKKVSRKSGRSDLYWRRKFGEEVKDDKKEKDPAGKLVEEK